MLKLTRYEVFEVGADSEPFGGAHVMRNDRGNHESAKYRLPFAIVRVTEIEKRLPSGKMGRTVRKDAIAFAHMRSVADAIVAGLMPSIVETADAA